MKGIRAIMMSSSTLATLIKMIWLELFLHISASMERAVEEHNLKKSTTNLENSARSLLLAVQRRFEYMPAPRPKNRLYAVAQGLPG